MTLGKELFMKNEIFSSYYLVVEIDGIRSSRFLESNGIEMETEVIEVEEGGCNGFTRKFPGKTKIKNLILKRGISDNNELFEWHQSVIKGNFEKRTIAIILMNPAHVEIKRWDFSKAFPVRWKGPDLDTKESGFPIEMVEIAFG